MHPRNPYSNPPDFLQLSKVYSPLKEALIYTRDGNATIDYKNEISQRHLTKALLRRDFNLTLDLPHTRLCPPVPNRLNYILWIQDIIACHCIQDTSPVKGIDIGTGASAIYPLLACRLQSDWSFVGTDIDGLSLQFARSNVDSNGLSARIRIEQSEKENTILSPLKLNLEERFHFTMCNPPFYGSAEEVLQSAKSKDFEPNAVCTGADVEMITPGGEVAFVSRMIIESLEYKARCRWYTSMVGKMSSLTDLVGILRNNSIDNYAITELVQGQTRRWAIAWSLDNFRLPDSVGRISNPNAKIRPLLPPHNTIYQKFLQATSHDALMARIASILNAIDGVKYTTPSEQEPDFICTTPLNTWSRAARRKKSAMQIDESTTPAMMCSISLSGSKGEERVTELNLRFDWIMGMDRSLFESFSGHVYKMLIKNANRIQ